MTLFHGAILKNACAQRLLYLSRCLKHSVAIRVGDAEPLTLTTGHMARFASGAVVASTGDSAVLSTCVFRGSASESHPGQDFVPLLVDFKQSAAAVGKIPTNYLRRELGQTDADILASRVIDRSLRPLFPPGWTNETQGLICFTKIVVKPLAVEEEADVVLLGLNAAASALHLSAVPWLGPTAAVRVGLFVLNPTRSILKQSSLDLLLTGCGDRRTVMLEMDGQQVPTEKLEEAIDVGLDAVGEILTAMDELRAQAGKEKAEFSLSKFPQDLEDEVRALCEERLYYILSDPTHDKVSRDNAIKEVGSDVLESIKDGDPSMIQAIFRHLTKKALRDLILDQNMRCDGRGITDFRPITITVDVFKRLHGSSLFQRGQTQVMSTVTFDSPAAAFHSDSISQILGSQRKKMFMLHYEFPSYATNEISSSRGANRRELGHGALAEKALKHVIPKEFPYSIRLACQVLESNGSSSMASACGGSLALLDAGVPLSASVAGVAVGLITDKDSKRPHRVLTDISGIEDYAGDMDFKIAGSSQGFTAMQLDVKIPGLSRQQLTEALVSGKAGVDHVLDKMAVMLDKPREVFKPTVPVIESMRLDAYKRQALFRAGGMHAKTIEAETGVKVIE
ncbi:putative polyribonucleotide nucleotidyltransferase [Ancylostoma caninum]|uniref:Putative polyribonucleotide nucleotidyltransferase n=1 Tax=Ancylostoma caninum TaxID=29170 RepID=A0A368FIP0_ANCCA|nr:putative polyribonucleotide nucleotidyltransferase [Ancylostoma caninum]